MRLRYRFIVTLVVAIMGLASAGSTAYASTNHQPSGGNQNSSRSSNSNSNSNSKWSGNGGSWREERHENRGDFHRDEHRDNHCCDNHNDHCCDSGGDFSNDCDWLRNHDHDAWLRDCQH